MHSQKRQTDASLDTKRMDKSSGHTLPAAYDLKVEYLPSKYALSLGSRPRFSWKIPVLPGEASRGVDQSAYRIIVRNYNSDKSVVWDSGIVESNASLCAIWGQRNTLA